MKIQVRPATLADVPAVRQLAIESVTFGIPHTRDVDPSKVRALTRKALENLEITLRLQPHFHILVAEDVGRHPVIGYIMLHTAEMEGSTGERQVFIHDLAVRQDYWGRRIVNRLINAAAEVTRSLGMKYLVGEVTASNERTLGTATRGLGFEIERHQIVLKVEPSEAPSEEGRRLLEMDRQPPAPG